jgi:hypothetical protein
MQRRHGHANVRSESADSAAMSLRVQQTVETPSRTARAPLRGLSLSAWCLVAAFGAYFCMYGFRKPYTAASFAGEGLWGLGYKPVLVAAQVLGYTVSKFVGIKVVSEVEPHRRAMLLVALVAVAELALVGFAVTPAPYNLGFLFLNGLPLGMVFGLVLGFLEGRRQTELLAAGLCGSFIVADGFVKSVGASLLGAGVSESWMPALAGILFAPPLVLFAWMLGRIPAPDAEDVAHRSERAPMLPAARRAMFRRHATGLSLLAAAYLMITILRSVRADFAPEIWTGLLGEPAPPSAYSLSELVVAIAVTALLGAIVVIRDNRRAFLTGLGLAIAGCGLLVFALLLRSAGMATPFAFMVLGGIGLYLPYIAVHTVLFERLIAMTRERGTIGYLMYVVDSIGYLGYVAVLLGRNLLGAPEDFLASFLNLNWIVAIGCILLLALCWLSFGAMRDRTPSTNAPGTGS